MSQILASGIPFKLPENCGEVVEINCDEKVAGDPSTDYEVVFPVGAGTALPLAGGAVVKLDFSALPTTITDEALALLIKEVEALDGNFQKIEGMVDARVIINSIIYEVGKSGALADFPSVTICTMVGDDSDLDPQKVNANVNKICSMKYIPPEVLEAIGQKLQSLEDSGQFGDNDNPIYGATGLKFSDYGSLNNEDLTISACLDLLPFYNIPEKNIVKKKGASPTGGYFTITEDNAFLKIPDLTGRDSAGFDPDLWNEDEERNLYIELLNEATLTRITISSIKAPPAATVSDYDGDYPDEGSLEIELDTTSDIDEAYLSLIIPATVPKVKGVKEFDNGVELTTIPMLTKPISSKIGDGFGVFNYEEIEDFNSDKMSDYLTEDPDLIAIDGFGGDYGKPAIDTDVPLDYIYGEQNRPQILLSNRSKNRSNRRNDRKYKNEKMTLRRPLFAQTRPRLYEDVPASWIKGTVSTVGEVTTASFTAGDLEAIKRDESSDSTEFALYLKSGDQIVRVPGESISLETISPVITKISPHGFIGGDAIEEDTAIRITGEDLGGVNEIILSHESDGELRFNTSVVPDMEIVPTSSMVIVKFNSGYADLLQNSRYELSVGTSRGAQSNELPIYISLKEDAIPYPSDLRASFATVEFTPDGGENPSGIPVMSDGQSAEIKIRSQSKLFSGNYPIYSYFAMPDSPENRAIMDEFDMDIKTFTREGLIVAASLEWELKPSLLEDFAARTKKKAVLKFPGNAYYGYNFSKLIGVQEANFVFLNDSMDNLVGDKETIELDSEQFSVMTLGGNAPDPEESAVPAFIAPGHITAVMAEVPGSDKVLTTVSNIGVKKISETETVADIFDNKEFKTSAINVYNNIPKMAMIFTAADMPFMRLRYDFLLDGKSIKSSLSDSIQVLDNEKEAIAVFRNVSSKNEGFLGLGVKVKDKRYNVTYDSSVVYGSVTGSVTSEGFSIDSKTRDLTLSVPIPTEEVASFVNEDNSTVDVFTNLVASTGNGVIVSNPGSLSDFEPFTPISITGNQGDVTLKIKSTTSTDFSDTKIIANSTESDISIISKLDMSVPSGSPYKSGQYLTNNDDSLALVFNRIGITDGVALGFNIPKIVAMATDKGGLSAKNVPDALPVSQGDKVWVRVENVKRNFAIKIGNMPAVKAVSSTRVRKGVYDAQFTVPGSLISFITGNDCMIICASGTNADRLKAKKILGNTFVTDLEKKMEELIFGKLKDKIPDIDDLKALLCKVPLRFMNMDLCDAKLPTELINSFCDLSFHLLADLKLALNGFQVLMIPIQVIFCIIDVLCALLNPIKTAKAMIRLFECLFDLVLLLPQISVPVMFLKLILHLLELLECVIDKILGIITAINAIVPAMEAALKNKDWASLKALEEVLSEYLFDLNVDLDILAPVISILTIFLQLLQLIFRFPCQVTPADNAGACSIDGTMLAGIVGGVVAPEEAIVGDFLIPVAQVYTDQTLEEAAADGTSNIVTPSSGDVIAVKDPTDNLYVTNMELDEDTLRATNSSLDFLASMAVSATKSIKAFKNPAEVEFQFKNKYEPGSIIRGKLFDPSQSGDSPLMLMSEGSGELSIASGKGNFVSPLDGLTFITKDGDFGSVKTLEQEIELPIYDVNDETAQLEEVGVETVWKTFDGIPMMTILDEEFNLYFINKDGIEFDDDNNVSAIKATMVNNVAAPKLKFGREETEIDSDGDGEVTEDDDSVKVYDFPQLYFVDMRACVDDINAMCNGASLNSFLLEEDNNDDIADIVEEAKDCLEEFIATVKGFGSTMRESMNEGIIPGTIDTDKFQEAVETLKECLGGTADKMCIYVVNTLTTTLRVDPDDDLTPSSKFFVPSIGSEDLEDLGFEENPPSITGASEYADGDGDTAVLGLGEVATITITPRDAMDIPLGGDLTDKIVIEIVSDSSGDAEFITDEDDNFIIQSDDGDSYTAQIVSNKEGEVKIRAKVCDRTIQAVTYDGLESSDETPETEVDCIDDTGEDSGTDSQTLGSLIKVDRIVSIIYTRRSTARLTDGDDPGTLAQPQPQQFGTSLEN